MANIKICLDAGHYGKYNHSPAIPTYYESDMNWKLHLLLKRYLEQYGIEVVTTRPDKNTDLELSARGQKAKGCNLFLSIHSNAVGSYVDENVDYVRVYVPLNGSGTKIGEALSKCIATVMETKQKCQTKTRANDSGGEYYGVIRGAVSVGVPGLILEHSFHTNTRSTKWLMDDNNLDKLAKAEAEVIANYFGLSKLENDEKPVAKPVETPTEKVEDTILYRVQIGAYSKKENAEKRLAEAKAAGFKDAFIAVSK